WDVCVHQYEPFYSLILRGDDLADEPSIGVSHQNNRSANTAMIESAPQRRGLIDDAIRLRIRVTFSKTRAVIHNSCYGCPFSDCGFDIGPHARIIPPTAFENDC